MTEQLLLEVFLMIFIPFITVVVLIPFMKKLAFKIGATDKPRTRHIHKKEMPKLGGLAIFIGFLVGYMLFGEPSGIMNAILIGSFVIILVGIIDDIVELDGLSKVLGQTVAACIIAFYGQILLQDVSFFGIYIDFGILTYPLTVLFILACVNSINLIDGMDGLSGGISSIYFLTIGIIALIQKQFGLDYVLTFVMLGSTLGFLTYNFYPASIFAGDTGSMFMGFIISIIALLGFKNVTLSSLIVPLLILAIPFFDTGCAILRRLLKGEKISNGDKFHIHHQLLNKKFSHITTVLIIYFINILFAAASIFYVLENRELGYMIYGVLLFIVLIFVTKTNIIFEKKEKKFFKKK